MSAVPSTATPSAQPLCARCSGTAAPRMIVICYKHTPTHTHTQITEPTCFCPTTACVRLRVSARVCTVLQLNNTVRRCFRTKATTRRMMIIVSLAASSSREKKLTASFSARREAHPCGSTVTHCAGGCMRNGYGLLRAVGRVSDHPPGNLFSPKAAST